MRYFISPDIEEPKVVWRLDGQGLGDAPTEQLTKTGWQESPTLVRYLIGDADYDDASETQARAAAQTLDLPWS